MKTMDLDTSKELAAAEEAEMEKKKQICTDCKITALQIRTTEPAGASVEEGEAAAMESKKFCTGCRTTKTPLWRVGPSGPKSLCNACGIRYRKKKKKTPTSPPCNRGSRSPEEVEKEKKMSNCSVKMSLVILGKGETTNVGKKLRRQRRRKLREEEIAAACLVALSCGGYDFA